MELHVQSRNLEVSQQFYSYLQRKLQRLQRRLPSLTDAQVELSREHTRTQGQQVVVQVTLNCNGTLLRAEERAPNAMAAVDAVAEVLKRRLEHYKGKLYKGEMVKKSGRAVSIRRLEVPSPAPQEGEAPELPGGRLVRVKRFPMKPMSVEEAAQQMLLLGHVFFLFLDSASGTYCVLYRRRDGDYGLIQPELE